MSFRLIMDKMLDSVVMIVEHMQERSTSLASSSRVYTGDLHKTISKSRVKGVARRETSPTRGPLPLVVGDMPRGRIVRVSSSVFAVPSLKCCA